MRSPAAVTLSLVAACLAMACGADRPAPDPEPPPTDPGATLTEADGLDACALLRSMDLSPYLGGPAVDYKESVRSVQPVAGITMCGASPAGGLPIITLMLRWGPRNPDPRSINEWIEGEFGADTLEMGAAQVSAMRAGEVIPGLGNFAVGYNLGGVRTAAWWGPKHHLTATASAFDDKSLARQAVDAVAREAIARY